MRRSPAARLEKLQWISDLAAQADGEGCRIWPWSKSHYARIGMRRGAGRSWACAYVGHMILEQSGRLKPFPEAHMLHSCDDKTCVAPWHLRWGTSRENTLEAIDRGLARLGSQKHNTHLLEGDVLAIRAAVHRSARSLSDEYGVHVVTINKIRKGATWKHILNLAAPTSEPTP